MFVFRFHASLLNIINPYLLLHTKLQIAHVYIFLMYSLLQSLDLTLTFPEFRDHQLKEIFINNPVFFIMVNVHYTGFFHKGLEVVGDKFGPDWAYF